MSTASPAATIRILSDYELDQVHAGGLNLDFGDFLGSYSSASDTISKGGLSDASAVFQRPIVVDNTGKKVQIVDVKMPKAPKLPDMPKMPKMPNLFSKVHQGSECPSTTVPSSDTPQVSVTDVQPGPVVTALSTAIAEPDAVLSQAGGSSNQGDHVSSVSRPIPNFPKAPSLPNAPQMPAAPALRLDVVAGQQGGKFAVAVSDQSPTYAAAGTPLFTAASPGAQNYLSVTETAQQNLSALVNINSAGSVVPVQLNLTVLVNSNVENLNLSNQLNLNGYSTYQF